MSGVSEPEVGRFALHADDAADPILGRLSTRPARRAERHGLRHHRRRRRACTPSRLLRPRMTGDPKAGAIVESRAYDDAGGRRRLSLAARSDFTIEVQTIVVGRTWLDRQLLAKESCLVAAALEPSARGDGSPDRSSGRRGFRATAGAADHLRSRSYRYVAPARARGSHARLSAEPGFPIVPRPRASTSRAYIASGLRWPPAGSP